MALDTSAKYVLVIAGLLFAASGRGWPHQEIRKVGPPAEATAEEEKPAAHMLYESGRVQFSAPPPMIVDAGTQCDANGNIYASYSGSLDPATLSSVQSGATFPISKITLDSERLVQFPAGQLEAYARNYRRSFYINPSGKVYALVHAFRHDQSYKGADWLDSLIVKYKDDGTVDSVVKLDPPPGEPDHFEAVKFAAFLDGNFLVTGRWFSGHNEPTKPLTGIFDRSGTFVAALTLPRDVGPSHPSQPGPADHSLIQSAQDAKAAGQADEGREPNLQWSADLMMGLIGGSLDGNLYLLRASSALRLYVINTGGSVVREIQFKPPEPGMRPIEMSLAGQTGLVLEFIASVRIGGQREPSLALLDLSTGKITDTYHLPPSAIALSACTTRQNEFLFLGTSKDNHLEVIKYVAQ